MRWSRVKPATSSMLFAAPMTATSTKATIPVGAPASRTIGIPQATSASANGRARRRPAIETAANAPNRPPAPTAALSRPTQPPPASSTWNATTTIRTLSAPRTTVWATISAITTRGPGSVAITRKPPSSVPRVGGAQPAAGDGDRGDEHRGDGVHRARGAEDPAGVGDRDDHAAQERAGERPEALERRGEGVGGDELVRRRRERGEQRLVRRPEERRRDRGDGGQRVDQDRVRAERVGGSGRGQGDGAEQADAGQEALAREAVAERGRKGRDQRGRDQADEPDDADAERAVVLVGEDAECHEVRPLGRDRRAPGQLERAQLRIGHHHAVAPGRPAEPLAAQRCPWPIFARFDRPHLVLTHA